MRIALLLLASAAAWGQVPRDVIGLPAAQAASIVKARQARTPRQVAEQLSKVYGHRLDSVVYIPAVAMIARVRLGQIDDVRRIVEPYASGAKSTLPEKPTASHLSGHLIFDELAVRTKDPRYVKLVKVAADLGFDASGAMLEAMPFHNEMSDAFFMGCPILTAAGRLTGENKYFDMCLKHFRYMSKLTLRADGIYRHSPLSEAAWGRGNGFPALGMALSLSDLPESYTGRKEILDAFRAHMTALLPHQDAEGIWHQVIDVPASYAELSATAMIAFAMERGMKRGWLDASRFRRPADRAWEAVKARTSEDGTMVDVCASTGKLPSPVDYFMRPASLGPDDRGGAMVMLLATERMPAEK